MKISNKTHDISASQPVVKTDRGTPGWKEDLLSVNPQRYFL